MKRTESNNMEPLIQKSLNQYREMADLLQSLQEKLDKKSDDSINSFNVAFEALDQQVQKTDVDVTEQLTLQVGIPDTVKALLEQRNVLQKEMLNLVEQTVPKASSIRSLLANEIRSIQHGRKALSGYKSNQDRYGKIVNKTL